MSDLIEYSSVFLYICSNYVLFCVCSNNMNCFCAIYLLLALDFSFCILNFSWFLSSNVDDLDIILFYFW